MSGIGQTWSTPIVAFVGGYASGNTPIVIVGGGYDSCEDTNSSAPSCGGTKGNIVYIFNGDTGAVLKTFQTERSVAADAAIVDINYDGLADYAYIADTGGNIYRIDFINGPSTQVALDVNGWAMHTMAYTNGGGRKFLFAPTVLSTGSKVYVAIGSGDREKPLEVNYPFVDPVQNRFYVYLDDLSNAPSLALTQSARAGDSGITNLDSTTTQSNFSSATTCSTAGITPSSTLKGWFMDLPGRGEQTVTTAVIVGGLVAFSTNRPIPAVTGSCNTTLGETRGYLVNLTN